MAEAEEKKKISPSDDKENENKKANEIKPDPDYEFRKLAMDLMQEWQQHNEDSDSDKVHREEMKPRVRDLIKYNLTHNAEIEACDLLIELEMLEMLLELARLPEHAHLDYERICLYLLSCVPYMPDPENMKLISIAKDLYMRFGRKIEALRCAMRMNDLESINSIFNDCKDKDENALKMQMAMMLGRQQVFLDIENDTHSALNANSHLHNHFLALARELDIMTPKAPEDVYKSHLEQTRPFTQQSKDTTRHNLASSFVNGFVNCGFGCDALFKDEKGIGDCLGKHKEWAAFSSAASFGLIHHWDANSLNKWESLAQNKDNLYIKGGAFLASGIVFSGVQDPEVDPAYAILTEEVMSKELPMRIAATFGLGLAYANSKRETAVRREDGVVEQLRKVLNDPDPSATAEVKALAGLSLGLVLVGTGNTPPLEGFVSSMEVVQDLIAYLHSTDLKETNARFVALGIGLIFLGRQDDYNEVIYETLRALPAPFGDMAATLAEVCAYAGTGNVLKVQKMLHICLEHTEKKGDKKKEEKKVTIPPGTVPDITAPPPNTNGTNAPNGIEANGEEDETMEDEPSGQPSDSDVTKKLPPTDTNDMLDHSLRQAIATLGIALIAMGEDIGSQMSLRIFGQLTRYGEPSIRRAVPLALALLSTSNPQLTIIETLSKYSHDSDTETARNAIFALGLIGAGTNNARILAILRQLASFHLKDQNTMMLLRIAQGLMHLGKGTQTLNPFHSDRQLLCPAAVAALLTVCFAFIDGEKVILNGRQHYLLYTLVAAIQPRMLITVLQDPKDETRLIQRAVTVRVGQAVDVVAQAGKPRAITGFQTHNTPVLLAYGERAELATDDYVALTPVLEGIVILKEVAESEANKEKTGSKPKGDKTQNEEKMEH